MPCSCRDKFLNYFVSKNPTKLFYNFWNLLLENLVRVRQFCGIFDIISRWRLISNIGSRIYCIPPSFIQSFSLCSLLRLKYTTNWFTAFYTLLPPEAVKEIDSDFVSLIASERIDGEYNCGR